MKRSSRSPANRLLGSSPNRRPKRSNPSLGRLPEEKAGANTERQPALEDRQEAGISIRRPDDEVRRRESRKAMDEALYSLFVKRLLSF